MPAGAGGALDLQAVAVEVMVALQRLDQQVVDRKPDRAAPVGVAAEEAGGGLAGLVVHPMLLAVETEDVRPVLVDAGQGADAVGREELVLVEQVAQHALQPLARRDGQQAVAVALAACPGGSNRRCAGSGPGRCSRNQSIRFLKPGSPWMSSSSRTSTASSGIRPTSERTFSGMVRPSTRSWS